MVILRKPHLLDYWDLQNVKLHLALVGKSEVALEEISLHPLI